VTAKDATKVYGANNPGFEVTYSGFVNGDAAASLGGTLAFDTQATASSPVGSYDVTPRGLTSGNYNITFAKGTLTVTKAALTVTANDATKAYGADMPNFGVKYDGLVNGDTGASLGGTLAFDTTATKGSPVGSYDVTPKGLTSNNYSINFVKGTLTVTKADLTVTADNKSKVYGAANPTFTASYSGFVNGDTATAIGGTLGFDTNPRSRARLAPTPLRPGSDLGQLQHTHKAARLRLQGRPHGQARQQEQALRRCQTDFTGTVTASRTTTLSPPPTAHCYAASAVAL
jgi:hypothetical protein